jgi:CRISPR/Cas system-associated protein Cas5 (RAMP superfamily)
MKSEIIEYISNIVTKNIQPNLLQIANTEFVKYINTGDRIKDSAYVLILNNVLLIVVKLIYKCLNYIYFEFNMLNSSQNYIDVEKVCQENDMGKVMKYKYKFDFASLGDGYGLLLLFNNWLLNNKIVLNSNQTDICNIMTTIYDKHGQLTLVNLKKILQ